MIILRFLASLLLGAIVPLGHAQTPLRLEPTPVTGEARMVTYPYDPDRVYAVLVRPRNNTHLRFAPGERVRFASAGDQGAFVVTIPNSREFVQVKPKFENTQTNLTVITNKREYQIELQSTAEGKKWYMRVAWLYGDAETLDDTDKAETEPQAPSRGRPKGNAVAVDEQELMAGVDPSKLQFGYKLAGSAAFRPTQVFDDGTHTYVRMPEGLQELPALFMLTPDTKEVALVNYSVQAPYLVVQRVMPAFVLRLGRSEVQVDKEQPKRGWFQRQTRVE